MSITEERGWIVARTDGTSSRRLPTPCELRVWRDYIETCETLRRELDVRMQEESGLSNGDYVVMLALNEAEGRTMRPSELAARIDWDRSRLSHHLGRMEKRGLIERRCCPEDSRGALVVLTDEGHSQFRRGSVPHLRDVREFFIDALTPEQLALLADATSAIRAGLSGACLSDTDA